MLAKYRLVAKSGKTHHSFPQKVKCYFELDKLDEARFIKGVFEQDSLICFVNVTKGKLGQWPGGIIAH